MIEPDHRALPVTRQCELLGLPRASYYHRPQPKPLKLLHSPHRETRKTLSEVLGTCLRTQLPGGSVCRQSSSIAAPWETTTTRSPADGVA